MVLKLLCEINCLKKDYKITSMSTYDNIEMIDIEIFSILVH